MYLYKNYCRTALLIGFLDTPLSRVGFPDFFKYDFTIHYNNIVPMISVGMSKKLKSLKQIHSNKVKSKYNLR